MTIKNETMTKEEKMQELAKRIFDDVLFDSSSCKPGESDSTFTYTDLALSEDEWAELTEMVRSEISELEDRCEEVHKIVGLDDCNWARKYALLVVDEINVAAADEDDDDDDEIEVETGYTLKWCYVCGDSAACDSTPIDEVEFNTLLSEHDGGICDSIFDVDD